MHSRILIICVFLGMASSGLAEQTDWQATLRNELHQYSSAEGAMFHHRIVLHGQLHYTVPARTGKILEERKPEELLPYLSELRKNADQDENWMLDEWIEIVSKGLQGTPQTISFTHNSKTEEIAARGYCVP